jgi:DNA processing protein
VPDPPLLLYVLGALAQGPALAIVGSRHATVRGRTSARALAGQAARAGISIVSGLAYGIDAAAHRGALDAGGHTVAVLASGLDRPSPAGNAGLANDIVAHGGAWISEQPPGMPARPHHFPERNRLISGLAAATLVVEARERSGSLWTARHALEQGRDVLVVPGPIDTDACRGSNALLREGAAPVLEARDLLELLRPGAPAAAQSAPAELPGGPRALRVLARLREGPCGLEELAEATGASAADLAGLLLELELAGRIERSGARVALSAS